MTSTMDSNTRGNSLLQLLDLSPLDHVTCLGNAKSTGRQCRCLVAFQSRNQAARILSSIEMTNTTAIESVEQDLKVAAGLLLCKRWHQYQIERLRSTWIQKLQSAQLTTESTLSHATLQEFNRATRRHRDVHFLQLEDGLREFLKHADSATNSTNATGSRRRRTQDVPLSMTLRSTTSSLRDSHQECPICMSEYDSEDAIVTLCTKCKNAYHIDCAGKWKKEHPTCPSW